METNTENLLAEKETPGNEKRIFILPPLEVSGKKGLRVLVQTDGNNRAKGLNEGYDDGGKNVVKIAEYLAQRGDVATMLACIMSSDNADKRGEEFFLKMYQAFKALGMRIQTDGVLVNNGIRLDVHGNLDDLETGAGEGQETAETKNRNSAAKNLATMIRAVCSLTHHIKEPKLRLVLGVNYDRDIAIEHDVDIIYRSGMEEEGAMRLSGMRTHAGINNVGSTTLWPEVTTGEIGEIIDRTTAQLKFQDKRLRTGYDASEIFEILNQKKGNQHGAVITIPYRGPSSEIQQKIDELTSSDSAFAEEITVFDKNGKQIGATKRKNGHDPIRLVPSGFNGARTGLGDYHAMIAPGQTGAHFTFPQQPEINYATVLECPPTPEGIAEAVSKAVSFCINHTSLKGAERTSTKRKSADHTGGHSETYYRTFEKLLDKYPEIPAIDINRQLTEEEQQMFASPDDYNRTADLMVAEFLRWGKTIDAPIETPEKLNAYINYVIISYFIAYNEEKPEQGTLDGNPLARAEWLIKYMQLVYTGDESIFDQNFSDENPAERLERLKASAEYLKASLFDPEFNPENLPNVRHGETLKKIAGSWQKFLDFFKSKTHPLLLQHWLEDLKSLYDCSVNEYDPEVTSNRLVDDLKNSSTQTKAAEAIRGRYYPKAPQPVRDRIEGILVSVSKTPGGKIPGPSEIKQLRLLLYLSDIRTTIGAGLVLRTLALTIPPDEVTKEQIDSLNETCAFFDYFVRVANDLSDSLKRDPRDRDPKEDSCSIMLKEDTEYSDNPAKDEIDSVTEVKKIFDWLQDRFGKELMAFKEGWPAMSELFDRADYVKNLYKEGHFRTANRQQMGEFLKRYSGREQN